MQPTPPPPGAPPAGPPPPGYPSGPPAPGYYPVGYPQPPKSSLLWLWILLGVLGGLMVVGILAAIAIPSFLDYSKKAKRSEVELHLERLRKTAVMIYAENAGFPTASAGPTPATACCEFPSHRCEPNARDWMVEPWASFDFEMYDPSYFQFTYTGSPDGQSFTATAIGDLDCDGVTVVYTLAGTVRGGGNPEITLTAPTNRD